MIKCFGRDYFAISNLFVRSCDGDFFTFPSPYHILIQSDGENKTLMEVGYSSFYDSPLILDYIFSLFFYVLHYDGTLETVYLESVSLKEEPRNESYGYKGIYNFDPDFVQKNISKYEFYEDGIKRIKQTYLSNPRSSSR